MGSLKTCELKNRSSARVNKSRHLSRPVGRADRAGSLRIEPGGTRVSGLAFVEDFTLEHSRPGRHITLIEISGSF